MPVAGGKMRTGLLDGGTAGAVGKGANKEVPGKAIAEKPAEKEGQGDANGGKGHDGGKGKGGRGPRPPDAGTPWKGGQGGAHQQ